jgi:hypothetical protein
MRVDLSFIIECPPDAAWQALHDPNVVAALYAPVLQLSSDEPLPHRWGTGNAHEIEVALKLFGRLLVGRQIIRMRDEVQGDGVSLMRTMHDEGEATYGPLTLLRGWHHRMAVQAVEGRPGLTKWHDRVEFSGPLAGAAWPLMRVIWWLRARRITSLARSWRV